MKVKPDAMARAMDRPDGKIRLYLCYGADESGSRALATRFERTLGEPLERIDLEGAVLKEDPARLADEAAAFSMFGEKRLVRVIGGDDCAPAVAALLEADRDGDPVVMVAGALKANGALLKLVLDHPATLACISYRPDAAALDALATQIARPRGLRLAHGVAARMAANCQGDRAILESEIEKTALYLDAAPDRPREATLATLDAIGANLDEVDLTALVNTAMGGAVVALGSELAQNDGASMIPTLRAVARRLLQLARLRAEVDGGKSVSTAIASAGNAVFFGERDTVSRQLSRWDSRRLRTAASRIFATETAIKRPHTVGDLLGEAELVSIARVAERLR